MPFYEYACCSCGKRFDVVKAMADIDREEICPSCQLVAERQMPRRFGFVGAGDWNRQEFNHGLGVACTPRQAEKLAKERGLEPVGNTSLETIHKHAETTREDKRKALWDDDRVKLYD
jgi:putative FmdB family regulatory protein